MFRRLPLTLQLLLGALSAAPTLWGFWTWSGLYAAIAELEIARFGAYHPALCALLAFLAPLAAVEGLLRAAAAAGAWIPPEEAPTEAEDRQVRATQTTLIALTLPVAAVSGWMANQPEAVFPMGYDDAPYGAPPWSRAVGDVMLVGDLVPGPMIRTGEGVTVAVGTVKPTAEAPLRLFLHGRSEAELRSFFGPTDLAARQGHLAVGGLEGAARVALQRDGFTVADDHLVFVVGGSANDAQMAVATAASLATALLALQRWRRRAQG